MVAILFNGNLVIGYHLTPDIDEFEKSGIEFIIIDELPEIIRVTPGGFVVERQGDEYVLVELPEPEISEQERIDQLESQNLMLMEAIADLYELYLGAG